MTYPGLELELFRQAHHWKRRFSALLRPCLQGRVLDAGCGIGANAPYLVHEGVNAYVFLDPDRALLDRVPSFAEHPVLARARRIQGTTGDLAGERFDAILYLDVLEHIADGRAELQRAFGLLEPGGHLLVLVPAFPFLYSPFDAAIGHHRRYTKAMLCAELPASAEVKLLRYLDAPGMLLSLGNRLLLRSAMPTAAQVRFWDRCIVPLGRWADPLVCHAFGRSLLGIFRKPAR